MFEVDTGLIFWTIISFVILLVLLYRIIFPPLVRVLEQRKQVIEGGLVKAKEARDQAEDLLKKYQNQLAEAERKTSDMFKEAEVKSQGLRDETLKKAQKEAFKIIENTKEELELYKNKAMTGLKEDITEVVIEVTKKLIKKELNVKDHLKLVETAIKELETSAQKPVST